jgi:hypothetical protein
MQQLEQEQLEEADEKEAKLPSRDELLKALFRAPLGQKMTAVRSLASASARQARNATRSPRPRKPRPRGAEERERRKIARQVAQYRRAGAYDYGNVEEPGL